MLRYRTKVGKERGPQRRLRLGDLGGRLDLPVAVLGLGPDFEAPADLTLAAARNVAKIPAVARGPVTWRVPPSKWSNASR